MVDGGGMALRMGVTPRGAKRILKYHSSSTLKGVMPLETGWFGRLVNSAVQWGFTDQSVSKYPPIALSMAPDARLSLGTSTQ